MRCMAHPKLTLHAGAQMFNVVCMMCKKAMSRPGNYRFKCKCLSACVCVRKMLMFVTIVFLCVYVLQLVHLSCCGAASDTHFVI